MAHQNVPVLSPTDATLKILFRPDFPQVLAAAIDHALFRHVDRILAEAEECDDCGFLISEHTYGCGGLPVCPLRPRCIHNDPAALDDEGECAICRADQAEERAEASRG